jgi:hypothetical protein
MTANFRMIRLILQNRVAFDDHDRIRRHNRMIRARPIASQPHVSRSRGARMRMDPRSGEDRMMIWNPIRVIAATFAAGRRFSTTSVSGAIDMGKLEPGGIGRAKTGHYRRGSVSGRC